MNWSIFIQPNSHKIYGQRNISLKIEIWSLFCMDLQKKQDSNAHGSGWMLVICKRWTLNWHWDWIIYIFNEIIIYVFNKTVIYIFNEINIYIFNELYIQRIICIFNERIIFIQRIICIFNERIIFILPIKYTYSTNELKYFYSTK